MTIEEIFDYVDEVKPNNYSKEIKTHWLNELEGKIQNEIMLLAQPEYISYVYRSSTELSGLSFPNDHTLLLPRRIKAHVGGELELNGLTLYAANNLKGLEILSISSDGKHLSFAEGSFTATGSAGDSGTLMFDGSATTPLIKFPFDRIYASWLIMKVSEHLEESSQFANSAAQFRDDWNGFAAWYADTYRPADGVPTFKGYYLVGKQGDPGLPGKDGSDGITPMIGENGNWYFGEADTGKPSRGVPGKDGADGHTPVKGTDYWTASDKAEVVAEAAEAIDLTSYAKKTEVPNKTSQLTNDSGFLTSHQDISGKQDKSTLEADVAAKGFTKNTGTYSKPAGGIPKADLAAAVQTSLGKADTALQSHQSLTAYRTAAAQDEIDSGKVDKVDGKGLSTNDYTAAAKAKVDAIPANPKYTDTVYDDTALKERVATIEGKESAWDAKSDFSGSYNDLTDKPIVPAGALILHGTVGDNNSITFEPLPNGQNPYSAATAAYVGGRLVQIDVTNATGDWNTILTLSRVSMGVLQFFNYEETEYYEEKRIQLVKMFSDDSATYSYIKVPTKTSQLTNDGGYLTLETLPKYGGESE